MAAKKRISTNNKIQYKIQNVTLGLQRSYESFVYVCMVVFEKCTSKLLFSSLSKQKTADYNIITDNFIYCYWDPKDNVSTRQDSRLKFCIHLGTFCIHYESLLDVMFKVWSTEKNAHKIKQSKDRRVLSLVTLTVNVVIDFEKYLNSSLQLIFSHIIFISFSTHTGFKTF